MHNVHHDLHEVYNVHHDVFTSFKFTNPNLKVVAILPYINSVLLNKHICQDALRIAVAIHCAQQWLVLLYLNATVRSSILCITFLFFLEVPYLTTVYAKGQGLSI